MIYVVDAGAVFDFLFKRQPAYEELRTLLYGKNVTLAAPAHIDVEVMSVIRRYVTRKDLSQKQALNALNSFGLLRIERYLAEKFRNRIWELRHNITPYDAAYIALAEQLATTLLTTDARLSKASGVNCEVLVLPG